MKNEFVKMKYDTKLVMLQKNVVDEQASKLFLTIKEFPTVKKITESY